MKLIQRMNLACVFCLFWTISTAGFAQEGSRNDSIGGPLTGPPVFDAPFSATATTTVKQTLDDGRRIERQAKARYYRDRSGRVRVEQTIVGPEATNVGTEDQVRITVDPDPGNASVYALNPMTRTATIGSRALAGVAAGGGNSFAIPLSMTRFLVYHRASSFLTDGGVARDADIFREESLGTRLIAGVETHGRRITLMLPPGHADNARSVEVIDERWESPQLKLLIYSRYSDSRTGVIEYRLSNIRLAEPAPDLFEVPEEFRISVTTPENPQIEFEPGAP